MTARGDRLFGMHSRALQRRVISTVAAPPGLRLAKHTPQVVNRRVLIAPIVAIVVVALPRKSEYFDGSHPEVIYLDDDGQLVISNLNEDWSECILQEGEEPPLEDWERARATEAAQDAADDAQAAGAA